MDRTKELAWRGRRDLLPAAGECDVRTEEWRRRRESIAHRCVRSNSCIDPRRERGADRDSRAGKSGEEGILWHKRVSRFKASEHGGYDTWWKAVGENHIEQEKEYVDNLVKVIDIGKSEGKKGQFPLELAQSTGADLSERLETASSSSTSFHSARQIDPS